MKNGYVLKCFESDRNLGRTFFSLFFDTLDEALGKKDSINAELSKQVFPDTYIVAEEIHEAYEDSEGNITLGKEVEYDYA